MTLDSALRRIDAWIEQELAEMEARIRCDMAATGPEDDDAVDRPPDADAPWRRCTVEEVVLLQRERFMAWRADVVASCCTPIAPPAAEPGEDPSPA